MDDDLRFFALESDLRAGFFGTTCAATTFTLQGDPPSRARLEFFFLTTQGSQRLYRAIHEVPFGKLANLEEDWDVERVHEEGRQQLLLALYEKQKQRAEEVNKPALANLKLDLKRTEAKPLVGAAMRSEWTQEIRTLAAEAQTPVLKRYCEFAMKNDRKNVAPPPASFI